MLNDLTLIEGPPLIFGLWYGTYAFTRIKNFLKKVARLERRDSKNNNSSWTIEGGSRLNITEDCMKESRNKWPYYNMGVILEKLIENYPKNFKHISYFMGLSRVSYVPKKPLSFPSKDKIKKTQIKNVQNSNKKISKEIKKVASDIWLVKLKENNITEPLKNANEPKTSLLGTQKDCHGKTYNKITTNQHDKNYKRLKNNGFQQPNDKILEKTNEANTTQKIPNNLDPSKSCIEKKVHSSEHLFYDDRPRDLSSTVIIDKNLRRVVENKALKDHFASLVNIDDSVNDMQDFKSKHDSLPKVCRNYKRKDYQQNSFSTKFKSDGNLRFIKNASRESIPEKINVKGNQRKKSLETIITESARENSRKNNKHSRNEMKSFLGKNKTLLHVSSSSSSEGVNSNNSKDLKKVHAKKVHHLGFSKIRFKTQKMVPSRSDDFLTCKHRRIKKNTKLDSKKKPSIIKQNTKNTKAILLELENSISSLKEYKFSYFMAGCLLEDCKDSLKENQGNVKYLGENSSVIKKKTDFQDIAGNKVKEDEDPTLEFRNITKMGINKIDVCKDLSPNNFDSTKEDNSLSENNFDKVSQTLQQSCSEDENIFLESKERVLSIPKNLKNEEMKSSCGFLNEVVCSSDFYEGTAKGDRDKDRFVCIKISEEIIEENSNDRKEKEDIHLNEEYVFFKSKNLDDTTTKHQVIDEEVGHTFTEPEHSFNKETKMDNKVTDHQVIEEKVRQTIIQGEDSFDKKTKTNNKNTSQEVIDEGIKYEIIKEDAEYENKERKLDCKEIMIEKVNAQVNYNDNKKFSDVKESFNNTKCTFIISEERLDKFPSIQEKVVDEVAKEFHENALMDKSILLNLARDTLISIADEASFKVEFKDAICKCLADTMIYKRDTVNEINLQGKSGLLKPKDFKLSASRAYVDGCKYVNNQGIFHVQNIEIEDVDDKIEETSSLRKVESCQNASVDKVVPGGMCLKNESGSGQKIESYKVIPSVNEVVPIEICLKVENECGEKMESYRNVLVDPTNHEDVPGGTSFKIENEYHQNIVLFDSTNDEAVAGEMCLKTENERGQKIESSENVLVDSTSGEIFPGKICLQIEDGIGQKSESSRVDSTVVPGRVCLKNESGQKIDNDVDKKNVLQYFFSEIIDKYESSKDTIETNYYTNSSTVKIIKALNSICK